jgi:hypothetical protein
MCVCVLCVCVCVCVYSVHTHTHQQAWARKTGAALYSDQFELVWKQRVNVNEECCLLECGDV